MAYIEISRALVDTRQSTLSPSTHPPSSPAPAPRSQEPCSRLGTLVSSAFSSPGPQFGQSTASDVELSSSSHSPNCAGLHSQQVSASTSSSHPRRTLQWLHCSSNSSMPPIRLVKDPWPLHTPRRSSLFHTVRWEHLGLSARTTS